MFETRAPQASPTDPHRPAPNRLVGFIAGRRSKWLVRALWIVVLVGLSPFSSS
jgi:putative drug exporter of the RND superfamily